MPDDGKREMKEVKGRKLEEEEEKEKEKERGWKEERKEWRNGRRIN